MNVSWLRKCLKLRDAEDERSSIHSSESGSKLTVCSSDESKMERVLAVFEALVDQGRATEEDYHFLLTQFKCLDFEDSTTNCDSVFYDSASSQSGYEGSYEDSNIEDDDDNGDNVEDDNANWQVPLENVPLWEAKPKKLNESENEYRCGSGIKHLLEKKKFCAIAHKNNEKYPKCQSKEELACSIGRMMNPIIVAVRRHSSRKIATKSSNFCYLCYGDYKKLCQKRNVPCSRMVEKGFWHQHRTMDENGIVACPKLQKVVCDLCFASGSDAHTLKFCPLNYPGMDEGYDHNMN